jgi:hypothetical protein
MYEWYYIGQYGQLGPLSFEQMEELVESQVVLAETYVWKKGMPDWVRARSIPEFSQRMIPTMPPPAPGQLATSPELTMHNPIRSAERAVRAGVISPCSRTTAGVLQMVLPGIGRMYLGYLALGLLQFVCAICTCGLLYPWSLVDGILILTRHVSLDGYGRALKD